MPDYAPHSPAITGCEWPGARQRVLPISPGVAGGARITSTASESVSGISVLTRTPAGGVAPLILCDVYDLANDITPADELCIAQMADCYLLDPGFSHWTVGSGVVGAATLGTTLVSLNEIVGDDDPNTTGQDEAIVTSNHPIAANVMFNANGTFFHGTDGSAGATITGKRIKYVEVIAIMSNQTAAPITVAGALQADSAAGLELSERVIIPAGQSLVRCRFKFKINNGVGGLPWDHTNIAPYLTGGAGFGFRLVSKHAAGWFSVQMCEFGVHVCAEARVATGVGFGVAGKDVFSGFPMANPQTGVAANWSKLSGHEYFVALTALRGPTSILGVSTAGVANPAYVRLPTTQLATIAVGGEGTAVPNGTPLISDIDAMNCLMVVGGGYSVDSNAYTTVTSVRVGADGSANARQDVSGSGSFKLAGILVAGDGRQDDALLIELVRGSTVLATATIDPADPDAPTDGRPTMMKRVLSASVTFSGGEFLRVSSSSTFGWTLPRLSTGGTALSSTDQTIANGAAARGIGGTADVATGTQTDYPWWVGTIPATPTGLTGASANFTTTNPSPGGPARISYAALNWTNTALGANFDHYEVLRNGVVIAAITAESQSFFNDFEGRRGVAMNYTVRVVRADGATSDVTAAVPVTVTSPADCDVVLASNAFPQYTVAYQTAPGHAYGRPSSAVATPQLIAGRRAPFVIRPLTEGNSDTFSHVYTIQMNAPTSTPTTIDRAVFAPLVRLIEAPAPDVAVSQGNGDRGFCAGQIGDGSMVFSQPGNAHRATVKWNEVDTASAIVLTAAPWHP